MATGGGDAEFYLRSYVGHKGKFGHEFLEFEFRPDGKLRYANNSNYKNDTMIRKEVFVSPSVVREARRIIQESEVTKRTTAAGPSPTTLVGRSSRSLWATSTSHSPPPRLAPLSMFRQAVTPVAYASSTTSSRISSVSCFR
ncbi:hypothetical protein PAHAL_2G304700 [Panicum hallii]|uniref:Uncharacterized protein n=1 Tax=Panicum hallii TaxID=206008 RepID=A0A2S3H0J7_9POAL|nr:protein mago nashi homolog 2-like [Panicum hallii]PAN12976.1 hypothetical protein PAHAL_2G304700 [Panicum hallii]